MVHTYWCVASKGGWGGGDGGGGGRCILTKGREYVSWEPKLCPLQA